MKSLSFTTVDLDTNVNVIQCPYDDNKFTMEKISSTHFPVLTPLAFPFISLQIIILLHYFLDCLVRQPVTLIILCALETLIP